MENTFAQKFWKDFELLSLEYIREQYKDTSAKCIHTSFIKDMFSDIITAPCLFSIYIQPIKFLLWLSVNGRVEPSWLAEE